MNILMSPKCNSYRSAVNIHTNIRSHKNEKNENVFIIMHMQNTEKKNRFESQMSVYHTTFYYPPKTLFIQCKKVIKKLLQLFCCSILFSKISNKISRKEPKTTLNVTEMTLILYFITSE